MASEVKKLCETDTKGNTVTNYGNIDDEAMQQILDLAKKYIKLSDSEANEKLQAMTLDDIRDASFLSGDLGTPEKNDVSIQLKWLPQAQLMGYYVAEAKGYYDEVLWFTV